MQYRTTLSKEVVDYIINKYEKNNGMLDKSSTAREVMSLFQVEGTLNAVRKRVSYLVDQITSESFSKVDEFEESIKELNEKIDEGQPSYEVINIQGRSYWKMWTSKMSKTGEEEIEEHYLPIEDDGSGLCVLNIAFDFSREGGNMTQLEIRNKYQLKEKVRQQLKKSAEMYKASPPIPDRIAEALANQKGEEHLGAVMDGIADKSIQKYGRKQKEVVDRRFRRAAEKAIGFMQNRQHILETMEQYLKTYKPREVEIEPRETNDEKAIIVFGDLHNGEDSSDTKENFYKMTQRIVDMPQDIIYMFCLGDLVETLVTGGMHTGQVEAMDNTDYVALVMEVVTMLENMLIALTKAGKIVKFHGVGGNHDRTQKEHVVGDNNMRAAMVYELVLRGVKEIPVDVNYYYDAAVKMIDIEDTRVIFHHGHDGFSQKAKTKDGPFKIAYKHGKTGGKNIIIFAHDHNTFVRNPSQDLHVVGVPAISPPNRYAKAIDESSNPGYVDIHDDSVSVHYL